MARSIPGVLDTRATTGNPSEHRKGKRLKEKKKKRREERGRREETRDKEEIKRWEQEYAR